MTVEIFSTDTDSGLISVVQKDDSGKHVLLTQIRVGNAPRGGVKFTRDGHGFVNNTSGNTISELDALSHEEVGRIQVGAGPRGLGIVPGDRYALVSNSGSDTISIVDLHERREVREIPIGRDPRHMGITPDGEVAYVCVWGDGCIAKLDISGLASGDVASVREVGKIVLGADSHPYSLNLDNARKRVYVATTHAPWMAVIDTESDEVIARVDVGYFGGRAIAFTPDQRYALLSLEPESALAVIDLERLEMTRKIAVGPGPRGVAVDPTDNTAYISNFSRTGAIARLRYAPNSLTVVDLSSADLASAEGEFRCEEVLVGYGPCSVVVFQPDGVNRADRQASSQPLSVS